MARRFTAQQGYDTLLLTARPWVIGLTLAKHGGLSLLLFGPPLIWAAVEGSVALATALALSSLAGVIPAVLTLRKPLPRDLRQVEAMISLALMFCLAAVFSMPAFAALGMTPISGLFEGMSAITTTGLSVATNPDDWPFAGHVLRSWMQWCGGLAMATAVLALILGPGPASRRLGQAGIDQGDRIASTRNKARQLLLAYVLLTLCSGLALALTTPRIAEGLVLALSAISTGGFAPRSTSLAEYSLLTQSLVIAVSLLGALSLLFFALAARGDVKGAWKLGSVQRLIWAVTVFGGLYAVGLASTGTAVSDIWPKLLDLWSGLSTAGFSVGAMPLAGPALVLFLVVMLAGGDEGSTAGGLKLSRVALLLRAARHALATPRLPDSAVAPLRRNGSPVSQRRVTALLALLLLYTATLLVVWCAFLAYGYAPGPALFDTVSALSTVGLSSLVGPELPPALQLLLTFAMWLGRLEFVAVLLIFLPRSWHHS
ncbi:TrkH family potassium uptake protein [Primorskyibacter sp. S187A]|uniref:TrkH family potassium uptake protein n=1 Tax=Primorskyibacter sp. S187A TaxID=3415130 RepID=UPI003C7C1D9C